MRKLALTVAFCLATVLPAHAEIDYSSGYGGIEYYSHSNSSSNLISFDWDSSNNLYYETDDGYAGFGGFYSYNGTSQTTIVGDAGDDWAGASVVTIGDYVYFNSSDSSNNQHIWKYGPLSGSAAAQVTSTAANFGLYQNNADLYIAGAIGWGTNHIYQSSLDASGNLNSDPPIDLGVTSGSSGPIAFDAAGNMYYAPGYGDQSIYKWSAAEVAAAIADPISNPLASAASRLWYDYSEEFSTVSGGTGMAFDPNGDLFITLTDYSNPSLLVRLDVDELGAYGEYEKILESTDRLGDLRVKDGELYVANDNSIYQLSQVPEPSSFVLLASVLGLAQLARRRRWL